VYSRSVAGNTTLALATSHEDKTSPTGKKKQNPILETRRYINYCRYAAFGQIPAEVYE
jgi:hypothetical protein